MPVIRPQAVQLWTALQMLYARCPQCDKDVSWRKHRGLDSVFNGSCCAYVFEAAGLPTQAPLFSITVGEIDFSGTVRRFPAKQMKSRPG